MRSSNRYRLARQFDREARATVEQTAADDAQARRDAYASESPTRARLNARLLAAWDALKAGDIFTPGNNPITIRRKNTWSVTDTSGISWSITEVIGLSRKEVDALRAGKGAAQ